MSGGHGANGDSVGASNTPRPMWGMASDNRHHVYSTR